ncbi:RsiV family protein [Brevundimonas sp.]|uniref:RsiV family protein n=1 Tax=Brevundimonas sp. TaxID=1871086 RepID=UPI003A92E8F7
MTALRALLLTAAVATALAGCNRREAEPDPAPVSAAEAPAEITPADAAAPMGFALTTEYAEVELVLPEAIKPQTDLHARLYAEEVRRLRQFVEGAQADRSEAGNDSAIGRYEKRITLTPAAETGKLVSFKREAFDYSGGAHPNTQTTGILWDKALKQMVTPAGLFRRGADLAALDQALCAAINTAKKARPYTTPVTLGARDWACPRAAATPFVLTPGTVDGKAGGLTFLIGPYQVGPYSEGSYEITLPLTQFRTLLASAYADEFAGQPAAAPAT